MLFFKPLIALEPGGKLVQHEGGYTDYANLEEKIEMRVKKVTKGDWSLFFF